MDGDDNDLGSAHEENVEVRSEISNNLDLNVEQNCCSPKVIHDNGAQSGHASVDEPSTSNVLGTGTEFESDEHAYGFYNKYARLLGFSVRKDWVNRSKVHGQVVSRKFTCSKEGYRRKDKRDVNVKKHRKETRTGCLAHMIITRQPDGKYRVTNFEAQHNHDNINPSKAHMLMLQNELSVAQGVEADPKNTIGPPKSKSALEIMDRKFAVRVSLDQVCMDFDNHLQSERDRDMNEGEAGRLLGYFQRQHFENPTFFYFLQLDVDDKVSNIFWADDNMVLDYDYFGDVICLDTTCRTDRELRPFVQFIGVNHHKQVVIFAAALLYDDTTESFNWLLRTFINAMSGKKPKSILTEQEAVIIEAVNTILPETNHFTCVWQLYENTLRHLSHVVKDANSFASDLRCCIYDHKYEEDFSHAWEAMLEKYDLQQNEWLRWMYREREKWAVVFGRNTFFLDAKGSHLGEILSRKFRSYLNSDLDVIQFLKHFERVVDELRYEEIEANDEMRRRLPRLMGNVVLLKHGSDAYTPRAFEVFQQGYEKSLNVVVNQFSRNGSLFEYKANTFEHIRQYNVTFNSLDDTVLCSCMQFERVGFLCSHALKVLDHMNIKVVPSQYILKRWTKEARLGTVKDVGQFNMQDNPKMIVASRYKDLCHRLLKFSARASESVEGYQFARMKLDEIMEGVERILALKGAETQIITSSSADAIAPENEPADIFLNGQAMEDQNESNRMEEEKEGSSTPVRGHQTTMHCNGLDTQRVLDVEVSPPDTVACISSPSSAYVSSQCTTSNPIMQGLYNFEANHVVHCMYEQSNLALDSQSNDNMYHPQNFFSTQQDSPGQPQLLQEPVIQSMYQHSIRNTNQMRQVIDIQNPHSSSFLLYDRKYRTSDAA
ncbi:protein FAR1-RELATED SEQUENCE 5-like isoform X1 [Neltuma alba]|uniref:protein FAR1-RELATED SEQUENCE 5-like isoform X1 n=1 Tax=Neltuma alba TaxID=207710 RepID=UPI0010A4C4B9|nr:protein FAR1-RELATED SEQUENCE 5-like isoform X1 [Prosopis alba]XP_028806269.1 protein FAR1-RELATED SEQUENCE 5-like isoform X1 [Prosopis alba]